MKIFLIYGDEDAGNGTACSKIQKLLFALSDKVNLVAPVRKGIAYNAHLEEIYNKDEAEWVEIAKDSDEAKMEHFENGLTIDILNRIYNF